MQACGASLLVVSCLLLFGSPAWAQSSYPAQGGEPLESGGLAPPPPQTTPEPEPEDQASRELERADEEDSGRGLEFVWLNAELGYQQVGLQTFQANDLVDAQVIEENQRGLAFGAGAGVRLFVITLGARFRLGSFERWQLWSLAVEGGFRIPLGLIEPYFGVGLGYTSVGSFSGGNVGSGFNADGVDITGYTARIGGGLDVYLTDTFSVGGAINGEMMFLSRPGTAVSTAGQPADQEEVYPRDGSSIGAGLTYSVLLGLHF